MGKGMKHYTEDGGEWGGGTHKMDDGTLHTGKIHNKKSKKLVHKKGPFKMKSPLYKAGMWANIHAKRKRGDTSTDERPSAEAWTENTK